MYFKRLSNNNKRASILINICEGEIKYELINKVLTKNQHNKYKII